MIQLLVLRFYFPVRNPFSFIPLMPTFSLAFKVKKFLRQCPRCFLRREFHDNNGFASCSSSVSFSHRDLPGLPVDEAYFYLYLRI